jgi:hypothetical protein
MFEVKRLVSIELDAIGDGLLEERTEIYSFGRSVMISWEGGFPKRPALLSLCRGAILVYPDDPDFDERRVKPPMICTHQIRHGVVRIDFRNGNPNSELTVCVLLPEYYVARPAEEAEGWPPVVLEKDEESGRICMVFSELRSVRMLLEVTQDPDEWQAIPTWSP